MNNNGKNKTLLCSLSDKISALWCKSFSSAVVFHDGGRKAESSFFINAFKKVPIKKYVFDPVKKSFSKAIDKSFIIKYLLNFFEYLLSLSFKCYSICVATFIGVSLFFDVLTNSFSENIAVNSLIIFFSLIPTLFCSKSISSIICESSILSFLFLKMLSCEKLIFFAKNKSKGNISGSIIVGFIASFFSLVYSRKEIFLFLVFLAITCVFLCKPETSVLTLALTFSLLPYYAIVYLSFVSLLSYLIKVLRGKRTFHINLYDLSPIAFFVGYFVIDAPKDKTFFILLMTSLYFAFSGILNDEKLIFKSIRNIAFSGTFLALYNLISFFLFERLDSFSLYFTDEVRKSSSFFNTDSISIIYGVSFVILLCLMVFANERKRDVLLGLIVNFVAICFCGVEYSLVALIVSVIIVFISMLKNKILVVMISASFITIVWKFFSIFSGMFNGIDRASILLERYGKYLIFGVNNSNVIYDIEGIPDSGNLWLQIMLWGGILTSLIVFASAMVFFRNGISGSNSKISLSLKSLSVSIGASALLFIIASFGCNSWSDYRTFILFWYIGGISSAVRKYCSNENKIIETESFI